MNTLGQDIESQEKNVQTLKFINSTMADLWESIEIGEKTYNFSIFSPGGNDTCFIEGIIEDPKLKKQLNDKIMELYPNVEQVGFVDMSSDTPRLEMAGGEFCGNATRSFAYKFFNGKEGLGEFKISGVQGNLKAGVTDLGEAWAQMPIYKDVSKVKQDLANPENYIVEMEGITHYIAFEDSGLDQNDPEFINKVKEKSFNKIKELGLDNYPAAGVMYVRQIGNEIFMEPVVYVKSINTLFYETACGSGTTAVGLVLSAKRKESIDNVTVSQPSGQSIKISVEFDNNKNEFESAKIQGTIQNLQSGTFEKDSNIPFVIEKVRTENELNQSLNQGGLIKLYQEIFSKAPYFEKFSNEEVESDFNSYLNNGILLLTKIGEQVVGFGAAVPLETNEGVKESLENVFQLNGWDIEKAWYMADLGVDEQYRGNDLAKRLVLQRLNAIPKGSIIIMRTSINNEKSWSIYKNFGFKELDNIYQEVSGERQDNEVKSDQRRFSYAIK